MSRHDTNVAWLLALFLAACSSDSSPVIDAAGHCSADSECPTSTVCRYDLCVAPASESRELAFRLVPPNSSTWRPQTVKAAQIDLDEAVNIALAPSIRVAGKLLYVNESNQVRPDGPAGVLTFRRDGAQQSSEQFRVESDARYALYLLPGRYAVTFVPDDESAPPVYFGVREFELDTDPELTVPLRQITVNGAIRDAAGPGLRAQALSNATIVASSTESGAASSVGNTDASGFFTLNLLPSPDTYDLRVRHETDDYLREITLRDAIVCTASQCMNNLNEDDTFQVSLSGFVGETMSRAIRLTAATENAVDFSGVVIEVRGEFDWGSARIRRRLDATGGFDALLPQGQYDVVVTTPIDFPLAGTRQTVMLDAAEASMHLTLDRKVQAHFDVEDLEGQPAAGARVELRGGPDHEPMVLTTDETGTASVFLEPIPHRVVVTPTQAGVARGIYAWMPNSPERVLRLPAAGVVTGTVYGSSATQDDGWEPVGDVAVQVLEDADGAWIVVGESTSRSDGGFKALIPALAP